MFDKQYRFKGKHALEADKLTSLFDEVGKAKFFDRIIDVYVNAPLVGFLYGRRADMDYTKNPETNEVYDKSIFYDRVVSSSDELLLDYQLIMLLDKQYTPNDDDRIDKAFRHIGQDPADMDRFDSYVRGGVDILYEKLIGDDTDKTDYINNIYEFTIDIQEKFNNEINNEQLLQEFNK